MKINQQNLKAKFGKNIYFQENLSKYSWFNLGGPAKIFFKPKNTEQLIEFLININNSQKITCLGAGSNTLIRDGGFEGAVIKLSPGFSFINLLNNETLEVGAGTLDKTLSRFGADNSITNYEFLSCIPGSIGGAIRMNSGCYGDEISNILISIKVIDFTGRLYEINRDKIKFYYRGTDLPEDLIIISAKFHAKKGDKKIIKEKIEKLINFVRQKVYEKYQINLDLELKIIGETKKNA